MKKLIFIFCLFTSKAAFAQWCPQTFAELSNRWPHTIRVASSLKRALNAQEHVQSDVYTLQPTCTSDGGGVGIMRFNEEVATLIPGCRRDEKGQGEGRILVNFHTYYVASDFYDSKSPVKRYWQKDVSLFRDHLINILDLQKRPHDNYTGFTALDISMPVNAPNIKATSEFCNN